MSKSLDAILIYPSVGDEAYAIAYMPLSVLAVASAAQQNGFNVKIVDQRVDDNWKEIIRDSIEDSLIWL